MSFLFVIVVVIVVILFFVTPLVGSAAPDTQTADRERLRQMKHRHKGKFIHYPKAVPIPGGGSVLHHYQICGTCGEQFGPFDTEIFPPLT